MAIKPWLSYKGDMELKIKITEIYLGKTIIINGAKLEIEEVDSIEQDVNNNIVATNTLSMPAPSLPKKKLGWPKGKPRGPRKKTASKTQILNLRKKPGPKPGFKKKTADSHKPVIQENEVVTANVNI